MMVVSAMLSFVTSSAGQRGVASVVFLIGIAIASLDYFLKRTLTLGLIEDSDLASAIQFKCSVIENLDIHDEQARIVCVIVQKLVDAKRKRLPQTGAA
jgi:hypothetical protein